jgi:hypothetical protein
MVADPKADALSQVRNPNRTHLWTAVVVATSLPFLIILCTTLWRSPFPLSEAVGLFEDVAERPLSEFFNPTTSYYRPLFYVTLSALWHNSASIAAALSSIRLLHIVSVTVLVLLFIWHLRPRTPIDAAAATVAMAVLIGSPGFLGNLELPLSYTIVGMAAAIIVWMLLERDRRFWHGPAIVALTLVAIGFKEQGLVIAPLVIAAWWMGAPGAGRATVAAVAGIAVLYVALRLGHHDASMPLFEQDVGFGFGALSPPDAEQRFGAFPLWIYAYSSASTIANVLFAEPTEGVFRITRAVSEGRLQPWHIVYVLSSVLLTVLIVWWGIGTLKRTVDARWSAESRLFVGMSVVLAACGVLSFNYSRDRLGGMAVVLYALAAFFAVRAAAWRAAHASKVTAAVTAVTLLLLASAWQLRAMYTIEFTRQRAVNSHREWITSVRRRQLEFAGRPVYLRIMQEMMDQGIAPHRIQRTSRPRWLVRLLGEY